MKIPELLRKELTQRVILHSIQGFGGALTASSIDVPELASTGVLDVDSFAQLIAGILVQTATVWIAQAVAKRRARRAAKRGGKLE